MKNYARPTRLPQLPPIREWSPAAGLGGNFGAGAHVVLLIRGELLHRYPDALIYAVRAKSTKALGTEEKLPLFRGRIDPDITFLGFDLTEAQARGTATDPGWFFVIQEQPTEPRFGMDVANFAKPLPDLATWNDLSWRHLANTEAALKALSHASTKMTLPDLVDKAQWGRNSAHQAYITLQRPVRIAIHAKEMITQGST